MPDCTYHNFDITVSGEEPPYAVEAAYRRLAALGSFPHDALHPLWRDYLATLGDPYTTPGEDRIAEVGGILFTDLMRDDVRDLWSEARSDLGAGNRLRIRLNLRPPAVAALPWEALHDPRRRHALGADAAIALVRVQNLVGYVGRPRSLAAELPLRVLLVAVEDPGGIDPEAELETVRRILAPIAPHRVELDVLPGKIDIHSLRRRLLESHPDILHIVSHGAPDGLQMWEGDEPAFVSATQLRATLQQSDSVRLVFLNACLAGQPSHDTPYASVAHRLLQSGVPAVIAMGFEILDRSAIEFAGHLYEALVAGPCPGAVDTAVSVARNNLYISNPERIDYATPILWLNVEDGVIFALPEATARERPADRTEPPPPLSTRPLPRPPAIDIGLEEKERWFAALPPEISHPDLKLDYRDRKRTLRALLQRLRQDQEAQERGEVLDAQQVRAHLVRFDEARGHIDRLLSFFADDN